jgi:hypothetical protein
MHPAHRAHAAPPNSNQSTSDDGAPAAAGADGGASVGYATARGDERHITAPRSVRRSEMRSSNEMRCDGTSVPRPASAGPSGRHSPTHGVPHGAAQSQRVCATGWHSGLMMHGATVGLRADGQARAEAQAVVSNQRVAELEQRLAVAEAKAHVLDRRHVPRERPPGVLNWESSASPALRAPHIDSPPPHPPAPRVPAARVAPTLTGASGGSSISGAARSQPMAAWPVSCCHGSVPAHRAPPPRVRIDLSTMRGLLAVDTTKGVASLGASASARCGSRT